MPDDPMDHPPADHGSDRWRYVEVARTPDLPEDLEERMLGVGWFEQLLETPCPDCNANLFFRHLGGDVTYRRNWHVDIAHDEGCPVLAAYEGEVD